MVSSPSCILSTASSTLSKVQLGTRPPKGNPSTILYGTATSISEACHHHGSSTRSLLLHECEREYALVAAAGELELCFTSLPLLTY